MCFNRSLCPIHAWLGIGSATTLEGLAELEIGEGRLLGYALCDICRILSDWHLIVKDNHWVEVELANWREWPAAEAPESTRTE